MSSLTSLPPVRLHVPSQSTPISLLLIQSNRSDPPPSRVKDSLLRGLHQNAHPSRTRITDILKTYDAFIIDIPTRYDDMQAKVCFCSSSSLQSFSRPLLSIASIRSDYFLLLPLVHPNHADPPLPGILRLCRPTLRSEPSSRSTKH